MSNILGLTIGISSVGFCLINRKEKKIEASGVHLFPLSENSRGVSLASIRGEKRRNRTLLKRRTVRMERVLNHLEKHGLTPRLNELHHRTCSPWILRKEGLERRLDDIEFSRVVYHLAKHRGFLSKRKNQARASEKLEEMRVNVALQSMQTVFSQSGFETIGAYLSTLERQRNNSSTYAYTIPRKMILDEVVTLFKAQRKFGNPKASFRLQSKIYQEIQFERPFKSTRKLVGYCTHFPNEKRAPKCSISSEMFLFYSKLNNLKLLKNGYDFMPITPQMREILWQEALKYKEIKYVKLRKLWKLDEDIYFNLVPYNSEKTKSESESKTIFCKFHGYYTLKNVLDEKSWDIIKEKRGILDTIISILSFEFDEKIIIKKLKKIPRVKVFDNSLIEKMAQINDLRQTINISIRAIYVLLPALMKGKRYDEAVKDAEKNGQFPLQENFPNDTLEPFEQTHNDIVNRSLSQSRKIINAVIKRFGKIDTIQIKVARDLGKSKKECFFISKKVQKSKEKNEQATTQLIEEFKIESPSKNDLLRYKLWIEQDKQCAYSGEYISPHYLFTSTVQIDHILPYSRSWDNSYMNKIICFSTQKYEKGTLTPFEKWGEDETRWNFLEKQSVIFPFPKRRNFLLEKFGDEDEKQWKDRTLNDTRYITRYLKNQLEKQLPHIKIVCVKSAIAMTLKHLWGLSENHNKIDPRNYALDAAIIACTRKKFIEKVETAYSQTKKDASYQSYSPWENFRNDVLQMKESIFVSRLADRTLNGQAHDETIKSCRKRITEEGKEELFCVRNIKLMDIKNEAILERLVDKERNGNLYKVIKERIDEYKGNLKKAFEFPLFMPCKDNRQGSLITSIKIYDRSKPRNFVRKGCADNSEMMRVDVFSKVNSKGVTKYSISPIYVIGVSTKILPNKICVPLKDEEEWPVVDDTYRFEFSLYKNDLFEIENKDGSKMVLYYQSFNRANNQISGIEHSHRKDTVIMKSIATFRLFKKYTVNYFGERHLIKKEIRLDFNHIKN